MSTSVGKLFLIGDDLDWAGEHSLLYGLPLTTNVTVTDSPSGLIRITGEQGRETVPLKELQSFACKNSFFDYVRAGLSLWNRDVAKLRGMELRIESTIPPRSGLGSSAAVLVSLFKALSEHCQIALDEDRICQLGQITERDFIGAVVGAADFYISYHGGTMLFDTVTHARTYYSCDLSGYRIVLMYSGHSSDTKVVNHSKLKRLEAGERSMMEYVEKTDRLVLETLQAIERNDVAQLGRNLTKAHEYISRYLKASDAQIDRIVRLCNENGAAGTKLTGCGMGGYLFSIVPQAQVDRLLRVLLEHHIEYILV